MREVYAYMGLRGPFAIDLVTDWETIPEGYSGFTDDDLSKCIRIVLTETPDVLAAPVDDNIWFTLFRVGYLGHDGTTLYFRNVASQLSTPYMFNFFTSFQEGLTQNFGSQAAATGQRADVYTGTGACSLPTTIGLSSGSNGTECVDDPTVDCSLMSVKGLVGAIKGDCKCHHVSGVEKAVYVGGGVAALAGYFITAAIAQKLGLSRGFGVLGALGAWFLTDDVVAGILKAHDKKMLEAGNAAAGL
jgi:hypothetical protein